MQWKSEFETGIAEIDSQHRTIVQLITEFEAAVKANADWNSLHPLLTRTKEYAKFHFAVEESLMQIFRYPSFCAHRSEHHFVLERVADLEGGVLRKDAVHELVSRFHAWVLSHFQDSDRHFAEFVHKTRAQVENRAAEFARPQLLIVEAQGENRELLRMLLDANGFRVALAGDGFEALAAARSDPPDAVISELLMPNMDGFALCRAWMQDAALRGIPFIFYSGQQVRQDQEQIAKALGAARYLTKPMRTELLLRELRAVLPAADRGNSAA